MNYTDVIIFIIELIGTVAFASSGAMVAIQKNMDIFGVNVLGITTAVGGGMIRDIILGNTPPHMFRNYSYVFTAMLTSCILFLLIYIKKELLSSRLLAHYEKVMTTFDAVGLGAFTVLGINKAIEASFENNHFLLLFVGVITGIGGGMLRDIFAGMTPFVFVKHVYACASIVGAITYLVLRRFTTDIVAMIISAILIVVIRLLAAHYRWNLPRVNKKE